MNNYYPFINTPLPYAYDALEPFIDEKTMHLHHDRHLQTYIDNLNGFLEENPSLQNYSLEELLTMWCNFRSQFKTAALSVFGSGYAWLVSDNGVLKIVTSSNQNTPIHQSRTLLLNIDVWEHAYYLKHYNLRAAYIDDWFHVVNWEKAAERFAAGHPDCRCR